MEFLQQAMDHIGGNLLNIGVVSFGVSFLASRLLLTAIGVVFAILSGVVYIIGTLIYMKVLMIAFLIVCIMMAIAPKR